MTFIYTIVVILVIAVTTFLFGILLKKNKLLDLRQILAIGLSSLVTSILFPFVISQFYLVMPRQNNNYFHILAVFMLYVFLMFIFTTIIFNLINDDKALAISKNFANKVYYGLLSTLITKPDKEEIISDKNTEHPENTLTLDSDIESGKDDNELILEKNIEKDNDKGIDIRVISENSLKATETYEIPENSIIVTDENNGNNQISQKFELNNSDEELFQDKQEKLEKSYIGLDSFVFDESLLEKKEEIYILENSDNNFENTSNIDISDDKEITSLSDSINYEKYSDTGLDTQPDLLTPEIDFETIETKDEPNNIINHSDFYNSNFDESNIPDSEDENIINKVENKEIDKDNIEKLISASPNENVENFEEVKITIDYTEIIDKIENKTPENSSVNTFVSDSNEIRDIYNNSIPSDKDSEELVNNTTDKISNIEINYSGDNEDNIENIGGFGDNDSSSKNNNGLYTSENYNEIALNSTFKISSFNEEDEENSVNEEESLNLISNTKNLFSVESDNSSTGEKCDILDISVVLENNSHNFENSKDQNINAKISSNKEIHETYIESNIEINDEKDYTKDWVNLDVQLEENIETTESVDIKNSQVTYNDESYSDENLISITANEQPEEEEKIHDIDIVTTVKESDIDNNSEAHNTAVINSELELNLDKEAEEETDINISAIDGNIINEIFDDETQHYEENKAENVLKIEQTNLENDLSEKEGNDENMQDDSVFGDGLESKSEPFGKSDNKEDFTIEECIEKAFSCKENNDIEEAVIWYMYALDKKPDEMLTLNIIIDICALYKISGNKKDAKELIEKYARILGNEIVEMLISQI